MIDRGDASAKREMRNTLKMWTYLAFQLLEGFENDVSRPGVMEVQEKVSSNLTCNCFAMTRMVECSVIAHL